MVSDNNQRFYFEGRGGSVSSETSEDVNLLALIKGPEKYVFLYDDESRAETLRTLGRFASNPELSFTWYDAAVLSKKIRGQKDVGKLEKSSRFFNSEEIC